MEIFLLIITFLARIAVGILFIVAGWSKLHAGESAFLRAVLAYELLPRPIASFFARFLPIIETMIGIMLVLGLFIQPLAYVGLALLMLVTGAVIVALIQKKTISCGCFGPKEKVTPMRWTIIFRNSAFMLMLGLVSIQNQEFLALDSLLRDYINNTERWYILLGITIMLILSTYLNPQRFAVYFSHSKTSV